MLLEKYSTLYSVMYKYINMALILNLCFLDIHRIASAWWQHLRISPCECWHGETTETMGWPWRASTTYWEALTQCPGILWHFSISAVSTAANLPPLLVNILNYKYFLCIFTFPWLSFPNFVTLCFCVVEGSLMSPVTTPVLWPQQKGKMGKTS